MKQIPNLLISKSRYMAGLHCYKLLWSTCNHREIFPLFSKATEAVLPRVMRLVD